MPRWLIYIILIFTMAAMIPPAIIARRRATLSEKARIHLVQDMDNQHRFEAQGKSDLFADFRQMRQPVEGAVARDQLRDDDHFYKGVQGDGWADTFPAQIEVTKDLLLHGQERFNIYCSPCHGPAGYGDGMVHQRALKLQAGNVFGTTWVAPMSLHDPTVVEQPLGQIFNTITHGVRNMGPYGDQIPPPDRWAIVAYVKTLQRSQAATEADLPSGTRAADLPTVPLPEEPNEQDAGDAEGEDAGGEGS